MRALVRPFWIALLFGIFLVACANNCPSGTNYAYSNYSATNCTYNQSYTSGQCINPATNTAYYPTNGVCPYTNNSYNTYGTNQQCYNYQTGQYYNCTNTNGTTYGGGGTYNPQSGTCYNYQTGQSYYPVNGRC